MILEKWSFSALTTYKDSVNSNIENWVIVSFDYYQLIS